MHELTQEQARRIAVRAQLLDKPRPSELLEVVDRLAFLQVDMTPTIAPNADLVLWSRLGSSYSPAGLRAALTGQQLFEWRALIRPVEVLPLYRADMRDWPAWAATGEVIGWRREQEKWLEANHACHDEILAMLRSSAGPLTARELPDTCVVGWRSSGWSNNRNTLKLLEIMELRGEVAVAGREGRERVWDVAERVWPDGDTVRPDEAAVQRGARRLRAFGIARAKSGSQDEDWSDSSAAGEPAVIEGVRGKWRVWPDYLGGRFAGRAALLSPLDRLVFDRKRMSELFEFDYQLEMYKPAAKRRWGYFALPMLYGDQLVGKLDATADREAGALRVHAVHEDVPFDKAMSTAFDSEIRDLARWLDLGLDWDR